MAFLANEHLRAFSDWGFFTHTILEYDFAVGCYFEKNNPTQTFLHHILKYKSWYVLTKLTHITFDYEVVRVNGL